MKDISELLQSYQALLKTYHFITPFDSGGSSAQLRKHLNIIAVGDYRNRLISLLPNHPHSDPSSSAAENAALKCVFSYRLSSQENDQSYLKSIVELLANDVNHPLFNSISSQLRTILQSDLQSFLNKISGDFDYRGAAIGNLILVGHYLGDASAERSISKTLKYYSELFKISDYAKLICPIEHNLHISVRLLNGKMIYYQHQITGKEHPPITSPITSLRIFSDHLLLFDRLLPNMRYLPLTPRPHFLRGGDDDQSQLHYYQTHPLPKSDHRHHQRCRSHSHLHKPVVAAVYDDDEPTVRRHHQLLFAHKLNNDNKEEAGFRITDRSTDVSNDDDHHDHDHDHDDDDADNDYDDDGDHTMIERAASDHLHFRHQNIFIADNLRDYPFLKSFAASSSPPSSLSFPSISSSSSSSSMKIKNKKMEKYSIDAKLRELISSKMEMIIYPIGSFFTSLLCNLLIGGVGHSVYSNNSKIKLYIANTDHSDPEFLGYSLSEAIDIILFVVSNDVKRYHSNINSVDPLRIITHILVDTRNADYPLRHQSISDEISFIRSSYGITVIDANMVDPSNRRISPDLLLCQLIKLMELKCK